jgi:hypothetical protein
MKHKLARLAALDPERRILLLQAFLLILLASAAVRLGGLRGGAALLASRRGARCCGDARAEARAIAEIVALAARHTPFRTTCLPRSLALRCLLQRRGIESELRIGVRKSADALEAHAWIEHRGEPLIDDEAITQRFAPFERQVKLERTAP